MAVIATWLSACGSNIAPVLVKPPPDGPAILVVGEITSEDPEARRLARFLRTALIDRLIRADAFSIVYDRDGPETDGPRLQVAGRLTDADRGSDAWRFIVGSGFGRPHLAGAFDLRDADGRVLAAFTFASDEPGPGGLSGHWSPLSMEAMARELGDTAAAAIIRWRHGEEFATLAWP